MQCNQPFYGNGLINGQFYSCNNTPLQCSQNMCPEIVGEGEVTSVTLPDGTIQFFFMPTMKWWAPNVPQCHPMYSNNNFNIPHCNNNVGTWFIRSISNPFPQNMFNIQSQRNEVPRLNYNSDYNMNTSSNGYQVKFHNDNWTSTTDLHYFCPSFRQRDYTVKQPCKATTTVQVETAPAANNTNNYEFICSKPCYCNVSSKPMSLVSLVEPKSNTKINSGSTDDCSCEELSKNHRRTKKEKIRHKPKRLICACESTAKIVTADKSVTTYIDEGSSCTPAGGRETQTHEIETQKCQPCCTKLVSQNCCERPAPILKLAVNSCQQPPPVFKTDNLLQRCEVKNAETWQPITPLSKRGVESKSSENLIYSSDHDYNGGCSSNCSCYSG